MLNLPFVVDSELLRELGERLVGKPFVALAELIKNSYDADTETVNMEFQQGDGGKLIVADFGNGMTFEEFKNYWMRIGSRHKEAWATSPIFVRPLTGQKGVGRLAVQFLAKEFYLETVSKDNLNERLKAFVCWEDAIKAGELTKANVQVELEKGHFDSGTKITLRGLNHKWSEKDFTKLAQELWLLVPPFPGFVSSQGSFEINLKSVDKRIESKFKNQMKAFLRDYKAKIHGENEKGVVQAYIQFSNDPMPYGFKFNLPALPEGKELMSGKFEIRIYDLRGRQGFGILVDNLKDYMHEHGGVHIYDSGFHLPYYGDPENDWLGILSEHARRIMTSEILPNEIQTAEFQSGGGLTNLPTVSRILGIVSINTLEEPDLKISISRDRLLETRAYDNLRHMIRYVLHMYAKERAIRRFKDALSIRPTRPPSDIEEVLAKHKEKIPEDVFESINLGINRIISESADKDKQVRERESLLGAFATAGVSTLSYHHEIKKQFKIMEVLTDDIDKLARKNPNIKDELNRINRELVSWVDRARTLNTLFDYYADADNLQNRKRWKAKPVIDDIINQTKSLGKGVEFINMVSEDLYLPKAAPIEWGSIFQNVFINAFNAMEKSKVKRINIVDRIQDGKIEILVQDTGFGIDISDAEELFMPFVRRMELPPEKKALGFGGTGIGLTIVRIIAKRIGCKVSFTKPEKEYKTEFSLTWREVE